MFGRKKTVDRYNKELRAVIDGSTFLRDPEKRVCELLKCGADPARHDKVIQHTIAHTIACRPSFVAELLRRGVDPDVKAYAGGTKISALSYAVDMQKPVAVKALLDAGANVNHRTSDHDCILAASLRQAEKILHELLLSYGANVALLNESSNPSPANEHVVKNHIKTWQPRLHHLGREYIPQTKEDIGHLISVMPVADWRKMPSMREMRYILFRTLPHTPELNTLHHQLLGHVRPPEAKDLQQLRQHAKSSEVGL